jgi:D-alanine transaminase
MSDVVYLNGSYVPKEEARLSPDDRGFLFGDGVYEVVRSYGGRLFALDRHMSRLAYSLEALQITGVDVTRIEEMCRGLLTRNGLAQADALVYLQITRGAAPRTHAFPDPPVRPTVYGTAYDFRPKGDPSVGVRVITAPDQRWARCDIKTVCRLPNCLANQRAKEADVPEALLVRDGVVLEGTHTSFFGVFDGEVCTAPLTNYVLPSVTRAVVLELCAEHGIPHAERPIFVEQLQRADELFLAGTTMEIMPIISVDGGTVAAGAPGMIARRLLALFHERTG